MVLRYPQVLRGEVSVGQRVALIGAGGIGVDTAVYLSEPAARPDEDVIAAYRAEWGIDASISTPGGLAPARPHVPLAKSGYCNGARANPVRAPARPRAGCIG